MCQIDFITSKNPFPKNGGFHMRKKIILGILLVLVIVVARKIIMFDIIEYESDAEFYWEPTYNLQQVDDFTNIGLFTYEGSYVVETNNQAIDVFKEVYGTEYTFLNKIISNNIYIQFSTEHNGFLLYYQGGIFFQGLFAFIPEGESTIYYIQPNN